MISNEDIDRIDAELASLTPWPWVVQENDWAWELYGASPFFGEMSGLALYGHPNKIIKAPKRSREFAEYWPPAADAEFIRKAPERIAALVEEVRELRGRSVL